MLKTALLIGSALTFLYISPCHADIIDDLIPLIIQAESSGRADASDGQSYGLMGISPCVLKDFNSKHPNGKRQKCDIGVKGLDDISHPLYYPRYYLSELKWESANIEVGTWYLRKIQSWLPEEYKNSKAHIVAAYNWGIGNLRKNGWKIPKSFKNHPNKIYRKVFRGEL